ncbi:MAG: PAS domain S-box protein [Spirulinaceae cyanobacterium]
MSFILNQLLKTCKIDYALVSKDLIIQKTSPQARRFADHGTHMKPGENLSLAIPELFGLEGIFEDILLGKRDCFELKSIARHQDDSPSLYFDLSIVTGVEVCNSEQQILIFFVEATEKIALQQALVQRTNEAYLLLSQLTSAKDYIDKVVDHIADSLLITNSQGYIKKVNRAAQIMFGYSEEELQQKHLTYLFKDQAIEEQIQQYAETEQTFLEVNCQNKQEENFNIAFSRASFLSETEEEAFIYIGRDITAKKHREKAIAQLNTELSQKVETKTAQMQKTMTKLEIEVAERQRTEARLSSLLNSLQDVVWSMSAPNFQLLYLNPAAEKLYGYSVKDFYADPQLWLDVIHPEDREKLTHFLPTILTESQGEIEYRIVHATGKVCWLRNRGWLIIDKFNREMRIDGIITNITERKHSDALNRAKLVQSEKMSSLGMMVAGFAHEINNPLSFVYSNLDYVKSYTEDLLELITTYQELNTADETIINQKKSELEFDFIKEDLPRIFQSMASGASRIRNLVLSLRNFSRLDESAMKSVDIHEGIDSTLTLLQPHLRGKGNHRGIQISKDYGNLPKILCYPSSLNQVFINIITNAIEAFKLIERQNHNPEIKISTSLSKSRSACIKIADNGPGMTQDVLDKIFDPFFTTKPIGSGTGLGLLISYSIIVESHKGCIYCNSAPGKGSEFVIKLPLS